jgi:DNA-binding NarL/FixJ family response regulator
VRVILVEDQALLREGLAGLFRDAGHDVAASLGSCENVVASIAAFDPDLVVLDIRLPPSFTDEGARAAAEIKAARPDIGVLLLSQHLETTHSTGLAGLTGFGYLLKDRVLDVAEFVATAERVAAGGSALDPEVVSRLLNRTASNSRLTALTTRERQVLHLVAQGLTNSAIATRLVLSERTIEAHLRRALTKLDLDSSDQANRRVLAVISYLGAAHDTIDRTDRPALRD